MTEILGLENIVLCHNFTRGNITLEKNTVSSPMELHFMSTIITANKSALFKAITHSDQVSFNAPQS